MEAMAGEMRVLNQSGDARITWDPAKADEVATARRMFDDLRAKGYMAYTVGKGGETGEVIREFDPKARRVVIAPPLAGG